MGILKKVARGRHAGRAIAAIAVTSLVASGCGNNTPVAPTTSAVAQIPVHWSPDLPAVIAYQGGVGYGLGESEPTVRNSIQDVGVSVVHIPVVLDNNGTAIAWSSTKISDSKCSIAPEPSDPNGPKPAADGTIGSNVYALNDETVLQGIVCDKTDPAYPNQSDSAASGSKLRKLVDLLKVGTSYNNAVERLWFDIELITDPVDKGNTATPEQYVSAVVKAMNEARFDNVIISSYDWRTLPLVHQGFKVGTEQIPGLSTVPTVALVRADTFYPGSPWIGGLNLGDVHADLIEAAVKLGVNGIAPDFLASQPLPQPDGQTPPGQKKPLLVAKQFLNRAHKAGLKVFPQVINNLNDMDQQLKVCQGTDSQLHLDQCVDGIITAYPDVLDTELGTLGANRPAKLSPR
jgi:glycerophosphoryl diester phosphodiesterase